MDIDTILSDEERDFQATSSSSDEDEPVIEKPDVNTKKQVVNSKGSSAKGKPAKSTTGAASIFDELALQGRSEIESAQSWDFRDAIEQMKREKPNNKQTSLDEKIRRTVESRKL